MSSKSQTTTGVNVGTSSLLLVFVVMCLVSFATLATVSANADKKLNSKVTERLSQYYSACNDANSRISDIDNTLKGLYESGLSRDDYFAQAGQNIDFAIPVSDVQSLNVSLRINYPSKDDECFYEITRWKLETIGTLSDEEEEHETLNLLF